MYLVSIVTIPSAPAWSVKRIEASAARALETGLASNLGTEGGEHGGQPSGRRMVWEICSPGGTRGTRLPSIIIVQSTNSPTGLPRLFLGLHRFPPRIHFHRGWLTLIATHWFDATDCSAFMSRDGRRTFAQVICGQVCDVTITWAQMLDWRRCTQCLRALGLAEVASLPVQRGHPDSHDFTDGSAPESRTVVRLCQRLEELGSGPRPLGKRKVDANATVFDKRVLRPFWIG